MLHLRLFGVSIKHIFPHWTLLPLISHLLSIQVCFKGRYRWAQLGQSEVPDESHILSLFFKRSAHVFAVRVLFLLLL